MDYQRASMDYKEALSNIMKLDRVPNSSERRPRNTKELPRNTRIIPASTQHMNDGIKTGGNGNFEGGHAAGGNGWKQSWKQQ